MAIKANRWLRMAKVGVPLLAVCILGLSLCRSTSASLAGVLLELRSDAGAYHEGDRILLTVSMSSQRRLRLRIYEDLTQNLSLRGVESGTPFVLTSRGGPSRSVRVDPGEPLEFTIRGKVIRGGDGAHLTADFAQYGSSEIGASGKLFLVARFFPCNPGGSDPVYSNQCVLEVRAGTKAGE